MEGFGFQKLDVYKEAKELVKSVYELLEKYPKTEMYCGGNGTCFIKGTGAFSWNCLWVIISNEDFVFVEQRIERVAKLLSGLRKALRRRMVEG